MTFRQFNQTWLVPGMQAFMIFGIVALCQPWSLFLHRYGLTIMLMGLIGFIIAAHIAPDEEQEDSPIEESLDTLTLNQEPDNDPTGAHGGTDPQRGEG